MEEIIKKWSETDPMLEATCVFECGELRQAISKIIEYGADNERLESLAEECGDVLICIDALAEKYKIDPKMRKSIIQKSIRLDERMKLASSGESDGKSAGYHKCINCKFYENFIGVCTCGDSEFRADYRDDDDVCERWEGRYGEEKDC